MIMLTTCKYLLAAPETELPILHLRYPTMLDPLKASPMITSTTHFSFRENRAVKSNTAWITIIYALEPDYYHNQPK